MPAWWLLGFSILVGIVGAFIVRKALRLGRLVTRFEALEPSPLNELRPGLTRTKGVLDTQAPLTAPLSGRPAVYYFVDVRAGPDASKPNRRLASAKEWTVCGLSADGLRVPLESWTPTVASGHSTEEPFAGLAEVPPERQEFFESVGIETRHLGRLGTFRAIEYRIEPGDVVHVTGTYHPERGIYRDGRNPYIVSAQEEIGYAGALKRELRLYRSLPPMILVAAALLFVLAWL